MVEFKFRVAHGRHGGQTCGGRETGGFPFAQTQGVIDARNARVLQLPGLFRVEFAGIDH